ncbi:MAG: ABC transporter substrate-binding protein [Alphaproteobacteria bacterium]|nr:MAG: ABC transporter substrate-binding protein [Alphaproteobacteria bacterium]
MTIRLKRNAAVVAGACALALVLAGPAAAKTFRYAFQGDAQSLDPHGLNETFTLGFLGNVYEGLTAYDGDMKLIPALATSWEVTSPTVWRFNLRKGVKFHDGGDFTADDVVFTWKRILTEGSDQKVRGGLMKDVRKIDDYTVEIETPGPVPTLARELTNIYIMDKEWAEAHNAVEAANPKDAGRESAYATSHANGTGPFIVAERQPDVKTVFKRFDGYWGQPKTNVTEVIFTPISQDATRVAALLSGNLDLAYPVPVQDWDRLNAAPGVRALTGPEARTIFLGMDQFRDELLYSNVKGKNPLKDKRVRQAFAAAIDLEAIKTKIMRGASTPTGLMIAPQINGFNPALNTPYKYDPARAKALLAEAGYSNGFEITLDCPNNRYVNDEKICQAVAAMLAKVGVNVNVFAQAKSKYFAKVSTQNGNDTSFYLLGWTPGSMDVHNVLNNLIVCMDNEKKKGQFNYGHYCNPKIDALTDKIGAETDPQKRQAMVDEAFRILKADVGYLPLHQQPLSWGVREGVVVAQRADNVLDIRNVVMP